jgi:hypothetical protein
MPTYANPLPKGLRLSPSHSLLREKNAIWPVCRGTKTRMCAVKTRGIGNSGCIKDDKSGCGHYMVEFLR